LSAEWVSQKPEKIVINHHAPSITNNESSDFTPKNDGDVCGINIKTMLW
jgi:hypothetical protein